MARIEDYRTRPRLALSEEAIAELHRVSEQEAPVAAVTAEPAEHSNFQMAHALREAKAQVIEILARFPVTALGLLHEQGQHFGMDNATDDSDDHPESRPQLERIKQHLFSAWQAFASGTAEQNESSPQSALQKELSHYPYTFEALVQGIAHIACAYPEREPPRLSSGPQAAQHGEMICKRLDSLKRQTRNSAGAFVRHLKADGSTAFDEAFLFLPEADRAALFVELLRSEQVWLGARQQLAAANSKLVLFIANQYRGAFLSFEDLVQEGQIGLLKAVDRFDHRLGFQFSTYAGYWIRQAISRALSRSERVVRIPCGQVANINKVYRAKETLVSKTGREASVKALADHTHFTESEINALLSISQPPLALESFDDDEDSYAPIDFLEQHTFVTPLVEIAGTELEKLISEAIKTLNAREAKIVCHHFGIDCEQEKTLQDIGTELNLTRERVRQIEAKALSKLRQCFGQKLMAFL